MRGWCGLLLRWLSLALGNIDTIAEKLIVWGFGVGWVVCGFPKLFVVCGVAIQINCGFAVMEGRTGGFTAVWVDVMGATSLAHVRFHHCNFIKYKS